MGDLSAQSNEEVERPVEHQVRLLLGDEMADTIYQF
jgi:hypothetical protein